MAIVNLELSIPESLHGISLRQYQKYIKLMEDNKDAEDYDFINRKTLEIFCGLQLKDQYKIPVSNFYSVLEHLSKVLGVDTPLIRHFSLIGIDGVEVEFGFVPDLDKMSYGEYMDIESYIGDWSNMHRAMAVLFRPVIYRENKKETSKYLIADYEGSELFAEAMKDMPVSVVMGAMVFFYRLATKLSSYTMDSILKEVEATGVDYKNRLEESGVDINQFIHSLKEMSADSMKLPNFHFTNV